MTEEKLKIMLSEIPRLKVSTADSDILEQIKDETRHRIIILADFEGQASVVRIYKKESPWTKTRYHNENGVLKHLETISLPAPKVLYEDPANLLVIHSFSLGTSGGDSVLFTNDFLAKISPESVYQYLSKLKNLKIPLIELPISPIEKYSKDLKDFQETILIAETEITKMANFFKTSQLFFSQTSVTHGDANPGNFIYLDSNFLLIDWENVCLDNHLYDFATVYRSALSAESWAKRFLKLLALSQEEIPVFYFNLSMIMLREVSVIQSSLAKNDLRYYRSARMTREQMEKWLQANLAAIKEYCDFLS